MRGDGAIDYVQTSILVSGEGFHGRSVQPEAQAVFVRQTLQAVRDAARLKTLHGSRIKGRPIKPLESAWDLLMEPWEASGEETRFLFRAPTLGSAAPALFEQQGLFEEDRLQPEWTVFDLLGQVIHDVDRAQRETTNLDFGMLDSLKGYRSSVRGGKAHATFEFSNHAAATALIDEDLVRKATDALATTPESRLVRVAGKLDMLRLSNRLFQLKLLDGKALRGVWQGDEAELIDAMKLPAVVMEGLANYRANGDVLAIVGNSVRPAGEADQAYGKRPDRRSASLRMMIGKPQPGVLASIIGKWPGDESEEEIDDFLRAIG
ncbi:MAG: hypothetical protein IT363_11925 [Methanoregulaceae archaeon]|nr:hypothetical protein [Methanoregulaceae archaeon]